YTPADYVRNILYSQDKDTTILVDNFSNSLIIETPVDKVKKTAELVKIFDRPNSELTTKVYKLDNAKSTEILPIINNSIYIFQEPIIKEQIKINSDERTNSIIVTAPKFVINHIEELLSSLIDKKLPQVMIDVQVVEINKNKMKDLGIYPGDNSNLTTLVEEEPTIAGDRQTSGGGTSGVTNPVIVFVKSDKISFPARTSINLQILMLEKQGLARILANPKILTSDGKEAKIFLGDKVPYITTSITAIGTSSSQTQTVNYVDVGVNLQFLPRVTKDKYVNLKINPQVSYLVTTSPAPWTATREISTELTVKSEETIVIAGLIKEEERKVNYKIPIIGDIPVIGSLFKAQKKSNQNTEVIFIIKPQIINLEKDTISN
ncbi:MAG: type II secretion system protein GspD, partial [bacterium]